MKLLFYNHTSEVSGAERVLLLILARLNRERFESVLVCPAEGELQKQAKAVGVDCVGVEQLRARFTWRVDRLLCYLASFVSVIGKVRERVIKYQPDLIHANSLRAGLVMSAATIGLGIPIVWHVHDLLPKHPFSTIIRLFVLLFPPVRIVAVSQVAGDRFRGDMLRLFSRRVTVAVIHNSVDVERLANAKKERAICKELRLRNTDFLIGIVGNLSAGKGQLELIAAYAEVLKRIPDAALLIVGSSIFNREEGYPEQLRRQAKTSGVGERVRFLGQRNDVPAILRSLDLLVLNSKSEAFPLVALEGLACEVPVLSTSVGGVPELITHGETGWLIPAGDQHKLVDAIVSLLEQPELRRGLAVNGRQRVERNFTVDKFMARFEALYLETRARLPGKQAAMEFNASTGFSFSRIESNQSPTN
ncbi:MAG: glycosyltransferase family 4 protein [Acidobacteriota bacterium]|nr:glycosyltransferase family 4 protein [Acidobacteriota bacterium]